MGKRKLKTAPLDKVESDTDSPLSPAPEDQEALECLPTDLPSTTPPEHDSTALASRRTTGISSTLSSETMDPRKVTKTAAQTNMTSQVNLVSTIVPGLTCEGDRPTPSDLGASGSSLVWDSGLTGTGPPNQQHYTLPPQTHHTNEAFVKKLIEENALLRHRLEALEDLLKSSANSNKKRINSSSSVSQPNTNRLKQSSSDKPTTQTISTSATQDFATHKPEPPPHPRTKIAPIVVTDEIPNIIEFTNTLSDFSKDFHVQARREGLHIFPHTPEAYRTLQKCQPIQTKQHFSFRSPDSKPPTRCIIRGLPLTITPDEIIWEFHQHNVTLQHVKQLTSTRPDQLYKPLPLFQITTDTPIQDLQRIHNVGYFRVSFEPLRRPPGPPQCLKCAQYGHTKNFCYQLPKCTKCAGDHEYKSCPKLPDVPRKCINCGADHHATYKGCPSYRALIRPKLNPQPASAPTPPPLTKSYKEAVSPSRPSLTQLQEALMSPPITELIKTIIIECLRSLTANQLSTNSP